MEEQKHWYEDEQFIAELDERWERYKLGVDKGCTLEEVEEFMNQRKLDRLKTFNDLA
jgi:hypothetical protein